MYESCHVCRYKLAAVICRDAGVQTDTGGHFESRQHSANSEDVSTGDELLKLTQAKQVR